MLGAIYQNRINYEELKLLYLGLFSRKPNNLFAGNYTELRADVLSALYEKAPSEEAVFGVLFLLLRESRLALEKCRSTFSGPEYSNLFKRFYEDRPRYRAFLAVAALSGLLRDDLSQKSPDTEKETTRISSFLAKAGEILENEPEAFRAVFLLAFRVQADSLLDVSSERTESEIAQQMSGKVAQMNFSTFHKRVLMAMDAERAIRTRQQADEVKK